MASPGWNLIFHRIAHATVWPNGAKTFLGAVRLADGVLPNSLHLDQLLSLPLRLVEKADK